MCIRDRLYTSSATGAGRRAAQTAMYKILVELTRIVAPVLVFTSQEIWSFIPKMLGMNQYVAFEEMGKTGRYRQDAAFEEKWDKIIAVRDDVKKALEQARADKMIGASLEAQAKLYCSKEMYDFLNSIPMDELADLMIVSSVDLVQEKGGVQGLVEGLGVEVLRAPGQKCERCWKYTQDVGSSQQHPTLCARCAAVLEEK